MPVTEILVLDSLMTQRFSSLFNLPEIPRIKFYEKDVRDLDIHFLSQFGSIDYVFHLSALTDASGTLEKRDFLFSNNLDSTKLIVQVCKELNIPMIFPSTTSVYGSQSNLVDETCNELLPQSPYAECKLEEERVILDAATQGLRAVILRFGTIHGVSEGMRFHTAVNKFCFQVATGQPISVWKTALDQKRPYLALSDASKAVAHVIKESLFSGEIYNVVTNNHTVREIISSIKNSTAKKCEIDFVESKIMNQLSYEVSKRKFESTGFTFQGDLQRDVEETMNLLIGIRNA
jgi:nucleoside-diphosphate-sugar epimerase